MKILLENKLKESAIDDLENNLEEKDDFDIVTERFEQMSSDDIINLLDIPHTTDVDPNSPMYILPNGTILSVAKASGNSESNLHSDIVYVILSAIANSMEIDWDYDDPHYEESKLNFLTYDLGWARVNCGETWLEDRFYCVLPNHMTSAQYRSLEKWLEWGYDTKKEKVLVFAGSGEDNNTYWFDEYMPEDIIKRIKRYYSSGTLYENRKEMKENMNNMDEFFSYIDEIAKILKSLGGDVDDADGYANEEDFKASFYSNVDKNIKYNYSKKVEKLLVDYFETKTRFNQWVEVYVTPADKFFYSTPDSELESYVISVTARDNGYEPYKNNKTKSRVTESNELEQRAKKHKKKSKGRGWHMAVNAGDVEKGIEVFNNSTSSNCCGEGGMAMGESVEHFTYYYDGPIYYMGNKISTKSNIYTTAKSISIARRNILIKAANGDELRYYDIVDDMVKCLPKSETPKVRAKCKMCGYELNDIGDCPVCDYGEDDLLENLSSLEALWELSKLD